MRLSSHLQWDAIHNEKQDEQTHPRGRSLATVATAYAGGVHAGAFQLNEQSVSTQGTSFAGRASNANDASTVFGNPAGMSFLDRAQITGGVTYLDVNTDIDVASANDALGRPVSGGDDGDMVPGAAVPSFYYVQPMNDRVALGFRGLRALWCDHRLWF